MITFSPMLWLTALAIVMYGTIASAQPNVTPLAPVEEQPSSLPQPLDSKALVQVINRSMEAFATPGMAVGVVHNGTTVFSEGFGQRNIARNLPVTPATQFRLASTSKAFTAAALAILVDQGKLNWHDPVTDYLPEFQLHDPWVTRHFTIADLLTHQSGLASGAGDSMLWPSPSRFSLDEIIHNLRYLSPAGEFRKTFAYSNVMYMVAGEVVARASGMSLASFIQQALFAPLNMTCFVEEVSPSALQNVAVSYAQNDTEGFYPITRNQVNTKGVIYAAAGGITCNTHSMLNWLSMWLNNGSFGGQNIISPTQLDQLTAQHVALPVAAIDKQWNQTQFAGYALGWRVSDMYGYKVVSHTGTVSGYQAYVAFVPAQKLGVVLLNNGSHYGARGAVMQHILNSYLQPSTPDKTLPDDWIAAYQALASKQRKSWLQRHPKPVKSGAFGIAKAKLAGTYRDTWFGAMHIAEQNGKWRISSAKMPTLSGSLEDFSATRLQVNWDNTNAASPALLSVDTNSTGQIRGFTLQPLRQSTSPAAATNHAYRDMYFSRMPAFE